MYIRVRNTGKCLLTKLKCQLLASDLPIKNNVNFNSIGNFSAASLIQLTQSTPLFPFMLSDIDELRHWRTSRLVVMKQFLLTLKIFTFWIRTFFTLIALISISCKSYLRDLFLLEEFHIHIQNLLFQYLEEIPYSKINLKTQ